MPDEQTYTITLPAQDWQVLLTGLFELPMKLSAATANRLQTALADAQKPPAEIPHIVKGGKP
ncbi:MAG TPA: hypothetical protein VGI28_01845 [Stellaceae bacterium]|jgi:hypothetical protein